MWHRVFQQVAIPLFRDRGDDLQAQLKTGYEIIEAEPLMTHPTFGPYVSKGAISNFRMWVQHFYPKVDGFPPEFHKLVDVARTMPLTAQHAMPGQPWYRLILGALVPPPMIEFQIYAWHAPRILQVVREPGVKPYKIRDDVTLEQASVEVAGRVQRFRFAHSAVKLGLPPDAFKTARTE